MDSTRPFSKWLTALAVFLGMCLLVGLWLVSSITKQEGSSFQLKVCALEIMSTLVEQDQLFTQENAEAAMKAGCESRDRWGHQIQMVVLDGDDPGFLVASPGRDGQFEVDDLAVYAERGPQNVGGDFDHDLVNHTGRPWFYVGH